MEDRVIAELNAELGSNIANLSNSKSLVDKYVDQLNIIEEKVKDFLCNFICFRWIKIVNIFSANINQRECITNS